MHSFCTFVDSYIYSFILKVLNMTIEVIQADRAMAVRWFGHENSYLAKLFAEHRLATRTDATPVAWMIERDDISTVQSGGRICLHYYAEEKYKRGRHYWTPDHTMAKRFATRDAAINETNGDPILRVAEHMWIDPHPPATDVAALVEAAKKIMPIRVNDGPDYAEVYFADGEKHSTHAMTMNPQDWLDLSAALAPFTKGQNDE